MLAIVAALGAGFYAGTASSMPLKFDVNDRGAVNTQAGWTAVDLDGGTGVTFTGVGGAVLDDGNSGNRNTNGRGGDTAHNDMWRDFIFANERRRNVRESSAAGIDITISGLIASTSYRVDLWAYDDRSNGARHMTWNGNPLSVPNNPDPTSLASQTVSFSATSDSSGVLVLEGRNGETRGPCCDVIVNGFQLTALGSDVGAEDVVVPEPSALAVLGLGLAAFGIAARRRRRF